MAALRRMDSLGVVIRSNATTMTNLNPIIQLLECDSWAHREGCLPQERRRSRRWWDNSAEDWIPGRIASAWLLPAPVWRLRRSCRHWRSFRPDCNLREVAISHHTLRCWRGFRPSFFGKLPRDPARILLGIRDRMKSPSYISARLEILDHWGSLKILSSFPMILRNRREKFCRIWLRILGDP